MMKQLYYVNATGDYIVMQSKMWKILTLAALAALNSVVLTGCDSDNDDPAPAAETPPVIELKTTFKVLDTAGEAVVGATVYAIPVADVEALSAVALTRANNDDTDDDENGDTVKDGVFGNYSAEALTVDEPLEDLINGNFAGSTVASYEQGVTGANGIAELTDLPAGLADKFFVYVKPAADDLGHLPGGSLTREAVTGASLNDVETAVEVSTKPSASATFVGTSSCIGCHSGKKEMLKTAHRLGFMNPGAPSRLQNTSKFNFNDGEYDLGVALAKYSAGDIDSGGTTIYFYAYDSTRKFDKYKTLETDPRIANPTEKVYATVRIYQDTTDSKYYAQLTNVINPADPNSPLNLEMVLTYGGAVYKQRPITVVDDSMFLIPLQFNARGDDSSADRVRRVWRDYHLDWWLTINATDETQSTLLTKPAAKNSVDVQCAGCHFNGFNLTAKADGYYQAQGAADINGETHPALVDEKLQELNVGCETCHGPGSEHVAALGKGKAIVSPQNLTPERETAICSQCHSRPQGKGTFKNDTPLDANNRMMIAGTSRADFLANNTSRHDSAAGDMWGDQLHSKSHHQQYTDFIQSSKYRNGSQLLTCASCHDLHAPGTDRHQLSGASDGSLCASCHATEGADIVEHQKDKLDFPMTNPDNPITCINCHNVKTATSGAGLNQLPEQGYEANDGKIYLHGDISSHVFDVPSKQAAKDYGMPVPYTAPMADNSEACGVCHGFL